MAQVASGKKLLEQMFKAGIIPSQCSRVVLDIDVNAAIKIYYEVYGDDRLLDIDLASGIEIECLTVTTIFGHYSEPFDVTQAPPAPPNREFLGSIELPTSKDKTREYKIRLKEYGENLGKD